MLAAGTPDLAEALLLLSYPLHPPRHFDQLRTAHFSQLRIPAVFVHGTRDPFGSIAEMEAALALIPARTALHAVEGAGHELLARANREALPKTVVETFLAFVGR
jgi:predicted alpha/beta-hydrolase family hydrolase